MHLSPCTIMNNEDADMDSVITTLNTTVAERASEIHGKHCQKMREVRKKSFESKGSEKYTDVNNSINRCVKKAKENCIGEQLSLIHI